MNSVFDLAYAKALKNRIELLSKDTLPLWGKMNAPQMLAHLNVQYLYVFEAHKLKRPSLFKRFLLKTFVKPAVVSDKPYRRNLPTAKDYKITEEKDFQLEKQKLLANIVRTQQMGKESFAGKEHLNFGSLTALEWEQMLTKHIEHHLSQFGV